MLLATYIEIGGVNMLSVVIMYLIKFSIVTAVGNVLYRMVREPHKYFGI